MARPSLLAAIAPFRGSPAGCLRVACETLLSPSAQKGKMNNGPRQALALNNSSSLRSLHYFVFTTSCCYIYRLSLVDPTLKVTWTWIALRVSALLYSANGKYRLSRCIVGRWTLMISWVLRTPSDPFHCPYIPNRHNSLDITLPPNLFSCWVLLPKGIKVKWLI